MKPMKNSGIAWARLIPSDWDVVKGKYCLKYLEKPVKEDDEVITCFRDGVVTLRKNRREDGFTISEKEIGYQGIDVGDLIVHGMDGFAGAIGISDSRGKSSPVLNVLDTTQNKKYIMYYLRTLAHTGVFLALSTGIRVRTCDTNWGKLKELPYTLPPIAEQQRIADYLDKKCAEIDTLSNSIQQQIDTLEQYKRAVITETVTKGLNPSAPMKDSGIPWIGQVPTHWIVSPIRSVLKEVTAKNILGKETTALQFRYGTIVEKDNFDAAEDEYVARTIRNYTLIYPGVLVLNGLNLNYDFVTKRVALSRLKGAITSAYMTITPIDTHALMPEFVEYLFKSYDAKMAFHGMGEGVRKILNFNELKRQPIVYPSYTEQKQIVQCLDKKCTDINAIIQDKQQQLEKLEQYKKATIFEYVTGKKQVPEV